MSIEELSAKDCEFADNVIKFCSERNQELMKLIVEIDRITLEEWKLRFHEKCQAATTKTSEWIEKMTATEEEWIKNAVEDYAKKLRSRNEETLTRLAKNGKKTQEYLEGLRLKFEISAKESICMETERLIGQNVQTKLRNLASIQGQERFAKTEEAFIASYLKEEQELIQRFQHSTNISDEILRKNIQEADEQFRESLVKEISSAEFPQSKFFLLVAIRDKKRQEQIESWYLQREQDFNKIIERAKEDSTTILNQLDTEFKALFNIIPDQV